MTIQTGASVGVSAGASGERRRALIGLSAVPGMYPRRLRTILASHHPNEAWRCLTSGRRLADEVDHALGPKVVGELGVQAARLAASQAIGDLIERCEADRIGVAAPGDAAYPALLAADREPPAVVFWRGDLQLLERRRVGVVGTRNATAAGRATATEIGRGLSEAGFAVVSGLARGIDAAAHRGVRDANGVAVGVVGNGLDQAYPRQNTGLWAWVAEHGLLLSEWPPATEPEGWRFPLRNRIIAALSEVLVVVESRDHGGSLITANEAIERGVDVMAVPGSNRHPAAAGTNALLRDGALILQSIDDVLIQMGLVEHCQPCLPLATGVGPEGLARRLLDELCETPQTLAMLVDRTAASIHDTALALARLERDGWVTEVGGYFEPTQSRLLRHDPPVVHELANLDASVDGRHVQ